MSRNRRVPEHDNPLEPKADPKTNRGDRSSRAEDRGASLFSTRAKTSSEHWSATAPELETEGDRLCAEIERYCNVYQTKPLIYFSLDDRGTIVAINPWGASRLAYAEQELIPSVFLNLLSPEDRDWLEEAFQTIASICLNTCGTDLETRLSKPAVLGEFGLKCKDGSVLGVTATATSGCAGGEPGIFLACQEIDAKPFQAWQQAKAQLPQERNRSTHSEPDKKHSTTEAYRSWVELCPDAIALYKDGKLLFINPAGARMLGAVSLEQFQGQSLTNILHPDNLDIFDEQWSTFCTIEQPLQPLVSKLIGLDGRSLDIEVVGYLAIAKPPWLSHLKAESVMQIIFRDITARTQAEAQKTQLLALLQERSQQQAAVAELGQKALAGVESKILTAEAVEVVAQFPSLKGIDIAIVSSDTDNVALPQPTPALWESESCLVSAQPYVAILAAPTETPAKPHLTREDLYFLQAIAHILATAIEREIAQKTRTLFDRAIADRNNGILIADTRSPDISHEQIITILESITDGFFALDGDYRFIYLNREAEEMLQRSREQLLGRNLWDEFPEAVGTLFYTEYARAIQEQVSIKFEAFYEPLNKWFAVHGYPAGDGLSVYFHDISDRSKSEEALTESQQRYRRIIETTTEGVWELDASGHTSFVNPQLAKMLGYREQQMLGQPFLAYIHEESHNIQLLLKQLRLGISECQEVVFRRADGTPLWTIVSANPILDRIGHYVGALGMITDITDRKQAEMALQQQCRRERLMTSIQSRIRQSLNLDEILKTTVTEVREFLACDRVVIFQFEPDWSGVVAVESVKDGWMPIHGTAIHDPCFEKLVPLYLQGRIQTIEDLDEYPISPCYFALLTQFQVKAHLVVPILKANNDSEELLEHSNLTLPHSSLTTESLVPNDRLWGLLIAHHCSAKREWLPQEIDLLQQLATQLGIAIAHSQLYQQVRQIGTVLEIQVRERTAQLQESLEFAHVVRRITDKVRESLDESQILQTAVRELTGVLKVDYCCAALYDPDRTTATIRYESTTANLGSGLGQAIEIAQAPNVFTQLLAGEYFQFCESGRQQFFQPGELGDLACPDLLQMVAAKLLVPIFDNRGAIGHLAVLHSQPREFSQTEISLVQQVAASCAIAVRQARLYQATLGKVGELEQLNQLKDEFLSTVSHELRTPMTNMKMAIQMLKLVYQQHFASNQSENSAPEAIAARVSRYLQILDDQCQREIKLINDLLDLQRVDASISKDLSEIEMHEWLPQLLERFEERTQNRQQRLRFVLDSPLPVLTTELSSLERVMMELINNACKYTPPGEEIIVRACVESNHMVLQTINTGIEIPSEALSHIFEKFYRVPSADPWKQGGTGLGLALVQKLVSHLGGTISVESRDRTTRFSVKLPLNLCP